MLKEVQYVLPAERIDMGGIWVKQALPTHRVSQVDPFLLLHHGRFRYSGDALAKHQGIGPHPHRGFSPVTFVIEGEVHHRDSRGNDQIAGKGDVQWMHAGLGIVHSERPSQALVEAGGTQEIVQLWVNSPAAKKGQPPRYQYVARQDMPLLATSHESVESRLVAGTYHAYESKLITESELLIIWMSCVGTGQVSYQIPAGHNAMLYMVGGVARAEGFGRLDKENLLVFGENGSDIAISTDEGCEFILLSGAPINEKVVQSGPFVMNSETEILEAMRDYQMGKMGVLIP